MMGGVQRVIARHHSGFLASKREVRLLSLNRAQAGYRDQTIIVPKAGFGISFPTIACKLSGERVRFKVPLFFMSSAAITRSAMTSGSRFCSFLCSWKC